MKLHEEKAAFNTIIQRVSERTDINPSIIEKDYYVSLVLQEIAMRQLQVPAFFKGGTCLYKIYLDMKRFSEDIDLTVKVDGVSNSQAKKILEKAAHSYDCMKRLKGDPLEENRKGSITSVYGYSPIFDIDKDDQLQRYGKLKIEATSFTISEPFETNKTQALIYKYAQEDEKEILREQFGIHDYDIQNISVERMFADKLLAAEFYLERNEYFDVSKHIYDLSTMLELPRIQNLLSEENKMIHALSYKREEENLRIGSDLSTKPLKELLLFNTNMFNNNDLLQAFEDMQRIYVIHKNDYKGIEKIGEDINYIKQVCLSLSDKERETLDNKEKNKVTNEYSKSPQELIEEARKQSQNTKIKGCNTSKESPLR